MTEFTFPFFYNYPPYFTLQPVQETRQKQSALWRELILKYCRHHTVYKLSTEPSDDIPLFVNNAINRRLTREGRLAFLCDLAAQEAWADIIINWAHSLGLGESVTTIDELSSGDEVQGTELAGTPRELIAEALKVLERRGKARVFKGGAGDDDGVKFFM